MDEGLIRMYLHEEDDINPFGKTICDVESLDKLTYFQYDFYDAQVFLDAIDINRSELFNDYELSSNLKRNFIFRGEENYEYKLLPSVMRTLSNNDLGLLKSGNFFHSKEMPDFLNFIESMNQLGLNLSNSSFELIKERVFTNLRTPMLSELNKRGLMRNQLQSEFPSPDLIKELALAQHYGIKTRLLDFSKNPYKSMFFAVEKIKDFKSDSKIALWVIPTRLIEVCYEMGLEVKCIETPNFQNKNMLSQEGVFVNYFKGGFNGTEKFNPEGSLMTLDQYLMSFEPNNELAKLIKDKIGKPMKFTLPHSEVYNIKRKLTSLNINWLTIQPDLDGVKKHVEYLDKNNV